MDDKTSEVTVLIDKGVPELIVGEIAAFVRRRYERPAHLLLGWRTLLHLSHSMMQHLTLPLDGSTRPLSLVSSFRGVPIVVDDTVPDLIRPLPALDDVRFGAE